MYRYIIIIPSYKAKSKWYIDLIYIKISLKIPCIGISVAGDFVNAYSPSYLRSSVADTTREDS